MGKGNKERTVVIPRSLYQEIVQEYGGKTWLFESKTGKLLNRHNIKRQIHKAGQRAGFVDLSPHTLRHARATDMLLNKNLSLKVVSKYLGHSSTSITADMYIHDEFDARALFDNDRI
jgi:integrase/recombinase XerD